MNDGSRPTEVVQVCAGSPATESIARAAEVIRRGGLVAFPTETVYGLGANALDSEAVRRVFEAKGRAADNPLIVHIPDSEAARHVVSDWPDTAQCLADRIWPGPLTLVLPKADAIPDIVTAGGPTVAVRSPNHPVAQALLRESGLPIAAPSANRSERISPTKAEHVLKDLAGRIDLILDAGPTPGGIESTVLDLSGDEIRILRPGPILRQEIEALIGPIGRRGEDGSTMRSPGLKGRHYSPRAALECVEGDDGSAVLNQYLQARFRVGWLPFGAGREIKGVLAMPMPTNPHGYANRLYAALHEFDEAGVGRIVVQMPPDTEEWTAIRDRLLRAAGRP